MIRSKYIAVPTFAVTHSHSNLSVLNQLMSDASGTQLYFGTDKVLLQSQVELDLSIVRKNYSDQLARINSLDSRYYKVQNLVDSHGVRLNNIDKITDPLIFGKFKTQVKVDGTTTLTWDGRDLFEKSEVRSRPYTIESYALSKAFVAGMNRFMIENGSAPDDHTYDHVVLKNNTFIFDATLTPAILTSKRFYLLGGLDDNVPPDEYHVEIIPYDPAFSVSISFNGGVTWSPVTNGTKVKNPSPTANPSVMLKITVPKGAGVYNLYGFFLLHK